MKNWIPKILAYILMLPVMVIAIFVAIIWNGYLIMDLLIGDIRRKGKKEIKQINRKDYK
jgi:hypothetical protein